MLYPLSYGADGGEDTLPAAASPAAPRVRTQRLIPAHLFVMPAKAGTQMQPTRRLTPPVQARGGLWVPAFEAVIKSAALSQSSPPRKAGAQGK